MKLTFSLPKFTFLSRIRRLSVFNALFPEEKIGGLEISDDFVRAICLKKRGDQYEVVSYGLEELPKGTVVDGIPAKVDELAGVLRKLVEKIARKDYATKEFIVSVSDRIIFAQPFSIPLALEEEMLSQFVQTNLNRIIPFDFQKIYLDWHGIKEFGSLKLNLFVSGPKSVIDRYREAFLLAGIELVALEPHSLALGRALRLPEGYVILFSIHPKGFASSVFVNRELYFRRCVEGENPSAEIIKKEAQRLTDFIVSELGEGKTTVLMTEKLKNIKTEGELAQWKALLAESNFSFTPDFGAAFGAAIRGLIPRSKDTIASVLPIGTELDYVKKKRKLFSMAIKRTTYAALAIAIAIYIGLNIFLGFLAEKEEERLTTKKQIPLPVDLREMEESAKEFNRYAVKISGTLERTYSPLKTLEVAKGLQLPGVTLIKVSVANGPKPVVNVSGVAATRESLLLLKDYLARDSRLSGVEIPVQALGAKANISFNITFTYSPQ